MINDLLRMLPMSYRKRFSAIRNYSYERLYPEPERSELFLHAKSKEDRIKIRKVMNANVENLSVILFIFFLKKMFVEGYKATITTVDTFKELGVKGYSIGGIYYADRNENVMLGNLLYNKLMESISDSVLRNKIVESEKMHEIVDFYKRNK